MTTSTIPLTACLNCGAPLNGHFCAQCGQKAEAVNPTLGEFLHELGHELAHVDGKILRSSLLLLTRPGFLSREHFEGRRARYVSPIRLYLVFSVAFFAVAAFSPLKGMRLTCTGCTAEQEAHIREAVGHLAPRAMFVLVPLFAGLVALAARRSRRNYPQHLYFAMHTHSAWFAAAAVAAASNLLHVDIVGRVFEMAFLVYAIAYLVVALRRAYDLTWLRSAVTGLLAAAIYWFAILFATIAMAIATYRQLSHAG